MFSIHRSAAYYKPAQETAENLAIMRVLDEQYMQTLFYSVKHLRVVLAELGYAVNERRIRRLMRTVGRLTIYCKPRTIRPDSLDRPHGVQKMSRNKVFDII